MKSVIAIALLLFNIGKIFSQETIEFHIKQYEKYYNMGQLKKALDEVDYVNKLYNENKSNSKCDDIYALILISYAKIYSGLGNYDKAIELNIEARNIVNLCGNDKDVFNAIILNNIALQFFYKGDFEKCILYCKENLKISHVNNEALYIKIINFTSYSTLCGAYYELMRYNEAIYNANKGIECYLKLETEAQSRFQLGYLDLINNRGLNYYNIDSLDKAESDWLHAIKIIEGKYSFNPNQMLTVLCNLLLLYLEREDDLLLLKTVNNIEKILKEHNGQIDIKNLKVCYINMGYTYFMEGDLNKSLIFYDKSAKFYDQNSNDIKSIKDKIILNINYFELFLSLNQIDFALNALIKSLDNIIIYKDKVLLTEEEQDLFNNEYKHIYDIYESFSRKYLSFDHKNTNKLIDYNLIFSNYLLRNSISMKRAIKNTNNIEVQIMLDDLIRLKKEFNILNDGDNNQHNNRNLLIKKDSIDTIERGLYKNSYIYNTNRNKQQLNNSVISRKLQKDQVLIQFNSFRYHNSIDGWTDSTLYTAYIIRKNQKHPEMVYLFEQAALDTLLPAPDTRSMMNNLYQTGDSTLYNLLWKPLEAYLKGVKTAYVAPSGLLHKIAFAAVPLPDGSRLSDRYQLRQVLSGHDVVFKEDPAVFNNTSTTSVALLGGINYEYLPEAKDTVYFSPLSLLPESTDRGTAFGYLPGTESEVSSIEQMLKNDKVNVTLLKGNNATEEQFKTLQGDKAPKVLHIATHGFFAPDPKRDLNKENSMRLMGQENRYTAADNPLYRSGLLLAGSNSSWTKKTTLPADQDGVLTAYEVANMDLSNTQLVVLSACETALGDVKGREGVFGLQRGFRLAGAKYMLMSLWRIPDKETAEYMTKFYSELAKTNNIVTSYQTTQTHMKATYPNEPQIWAGMVLVE